MMDKSFDSEMVVTLGWKPLLRHFSTLMFSSSLWNSSPKPIIWLKMWVNLFCTSTMDSPCCLFNNSYCCIEACFLALFTSFIPSFVTLSTSHISFALLQLETLKNSSMFNDDVRMFFAVQLCWALLLSSSVHSVQGLSTYLFSTTHLGV